jgi:tryptophan-rich sensory protein
MNFVLFPIVVLFSLLLVIVAAFTTLFSKLAEMIAFVISIILVTTKSDMLFKVAIMIVSLAGMTIIPPEDEVDE